MKFTLFGLFKPTPKKKSLRDKINKAKEIIDYSYYRSWCGSWYSINNYEEVLKILEYEDTLGMYLFIRDFIAKKIDTETCVKYLLRN